ncbi:MAG: hypothetical protein JNM51_03695 [Bacteroidia bacterium]|nr:hypothetical protein [Bacteroidia bacterium]
MNTNIFIKAIHIISKDNRIHPSHISLYFTLLSLWHENKLQNPINISRKEILANSKIKSNATYHKCIKELNDFGYIKYDPSYNPFNGSLITILKFNEIQEENNTITKKEILIRISIEV